VCQQPHLAFSPILSIPSIVVYRRGLLPQHAEIESKKTATQTKPSSLHQAEKEKKLPINPCARNPTKANLGAKQKKFEIINATPSMQTVASAAQGRKREQGYQSRT
jgi:hypothetical protein